jgi:hypothetical protein
VQSPRQGGVSFFVLCTSGCNLTLVGCHYATDGTLGDAFLTVAKALVQ